MPPTSLLQTLAEVASVVDSQLAELQKHSSVFDPDRLEPTYIVIGARFQWRRLRESGVHLQQQLRTSIHRLERAFSLLNPILSDEEVKTTESVMRRLKETVMQERLEYDENAVSIFQETRQGITYCCDIVSRRVSGSGSGTAYLVDTNALIAARQLSVLATQLGEGTIVLVPPVLKELDALKTRDKSPGLKDAAESLIRQIGELRRRGSLLDGVTIQGKTTARAIAVEPDFSKLPRELDSQVADDRFIGHALAYIAANPRSAIAVVTRDINLLNKCEFFAVPFIEAPR